MCDLKQQAQTNVKPKLTADTKTFLPFVKNTVVCTAEAGLL